MTDRLIFGEAYIEDDEPDNNVPSYMTVHPAEQGTEEWRAARLGMVTASQVKRLLTPGLKPANNEKSRAYVLQLAAERILGRAEPEVLTDDMLRGRNDEYFARHYYATHVAPVSQSGLIVTRKYGFALGCSPDGLVGSDGMIEIKSRKPRLQLQAILDHMIDNSGTVPEDYIVQLQTALLVTERQWIDLCVYSNGMHMAVIRVTPEWPIQQAIIDACAAAEEQIKRIVETYHWAETQPQLRLIRTKWIDPGDILQ